MYYILVDDVRNEEREKYVPSERTHILALTNFLVPQHYTYNVLH